MAKIGDKNMLEKFTLPKLNDSMILELQYCKSRYDFVDKIADKRVSKIKTKKESLAICFEILSGIFNFPYDTKLVFNKESFDKDLYLDSIDNLRFEEAFYNLYKACFIKYIRTLHTTNLDKIDDKIYTIVKLALLNNNEEVINKVVELCYKEHTENILNIDMKSSKISVKDVAFLNEENNKRNKNLKLEVMEYSLLSDLSRHGMSNLFSCFSSDIFNSLTIKEKIHICNLVFNYFSIDGKFDLYHDLKKLIKKDSNNKECLEIVINKLMRKGNTIIIRRKNMDMINDVLSWISVVDNNETNKKEVNRLNELNKLIDNLKR